MRTDDLISMLSADPAPAPDRRRFWPLVIALGLIGALALMLLTIGPRADLPQALTPTALKMLASAMIAVAALTQVARLSQPARAAGALDWLSIGVLGAAALIALSAGVVGMDRLTGAEPLPRCLWAVPLFSIPSALLIGWLARGMAPTRPALTGAATGAAAGGIGAIAYSLWCPYDTTLYFTLSFYVLAIAICATLGAVAGARLLRW